MPAWISEPSSSLPVLPQHWAQSYGIVGRLPVGLAPGMGQNAFFSYVIVIGMGHPWQTALGAVFISGVIFVVISIVPIREWLINSIPMNLKRAFLLASAFLLALSRCRAPASLKAMMPPWSPSPALRDRNAVLPDWVYAHHHFKCKTSLWCDHHGHPLSLAARMGHRHLGVWWTRISAAFYCARAV